MINHKLTLIMSREFPLCKVMGAAFKGGWVNCWQLRKSYSVVPANALLKSVFYWKLAVNCCNLLASFSQFLEVESCNPEPFLFVFRTILVSVW